MTDESIGPRAIADSYLNQVAAHDPLEAAWLGLHPGDERQPDLSPEGFEAHAEIARRALAALDAAPVTVDPAEQACARLLRERLTAELAVQDSGDNFRQLRAIGAHVHQVRDIFTFMPTATDEDWAAVAGRLRNLPGALDGYRTTITEGISRDLLAAPRQVAVVISQLTAWTGQTAGRQAGGGGAGWFADFVADGPESLRTELDTAALRATAAVAEFRDWMRDTYAPAAARTPDAVGRERYLRAVRYCTGADLDLDEAYEWAWSEFHGTLAEMRIEADRVLPGSTPLEAMHHLEQHGHAVKGEEGIRDWLQRIMDEAIDALDGHHFDFADPIRKVESLIAPAGSVGGPTTRAPASTSAAPAGPTCPPSAGSPSRPGSSSAPGTTRACPATTCSSPSGSPWPTG